MATNSLRKPKGVKTAPWKEFMAEVADAASRQSKKTSGPVENLEPNGKGSIFPLVIPPPDEQRCQATTNKGTRCQRYRMRGASRCQVHGGHREAPRNKATIRLWHKGQITGRDQAIDARAELAAMKVPMAERQIVRDALRSKGHRADPIKLLHGIKAMRADNEGISYRRWLSSLSTPNSIHKANK